MKRRIKWKNIFVFIFILIFSILLIISLVNIIKWQLDNIHNKDNMDNVSDKVKIKKVKDNKNTEIINQDVDKSNPYWDFIKMDLINVDFSKLKKENSDTVGWIQVKGTNINYPFVQTNNNDYYLHHSFNKSYNSAGWVFLDYRNKINNEDRNMILYAHGRLNKTMFGSLKNVFKNGWLENPNNYVVRLSTEYENTMWQVFSIYKIETTSDYLKINFISDDDFLEFANKLKDRSNHDFNINVLPSDRILTLSTCYDKTHKVVLHAKLIKKGKR